MDEHQIDPQPDATPLPQIEETPTRWHRVAPWVVIAALAAIVCLSQITGLRTGRFLQMPRLFSLAPSQEIAQRPYLFYRVTQPERREALRFIFAGDPKARTSAERQYSIWAAEPKSAVRYANYVLALQEENSAKDSTLSLSTYEAALRRGMEIDPDNAFYHYLLADELLKVALGTTKQMALNYSLGRFTRVTLPTPHGKPVRIQQYTVVDRNALDAAMREVRLGAAKSRLTGCQREMAELRLASLPAPRYVEDYLLRKKIRGEWENPETWAMRDMMSAIPTCALLLAKEGRTADAAAILDANRKMGMQLGATADNALGIAMALAMVEYSGTELAAINEMLGRQALAAHDRAVAQQLHAQRIARGKASEGQSSPEDSLVFFSILLMDTSFESTPPAEMVPLRQIEYALIGGQLFFGAVLLFMGVLLAYHLLVWLRGARLLRRAGRRTPLIAPSRKVWLASLGASLTPFLLFAVITRLPIGWSHLDVTLESGIQSAVPAVAAILIYLIVLPVQLGRYFTRRCLSLGLPAPQRSTSWWAMDLSAVVGLILAFGYKGSGIGMWLNAPTLLYMGYPGALTVVMISLAVFLAVCAIIVLPGSRQPATPDDLYRATMARSKASIYAVLVLVLCAGMFGLRAHEQYWMKREHAIFYHSNTMPSVTPSDERMLNARRAEFVKVMGESGKR